MKRRPTKGKGRRKPRAPEPPPKLFSLARMPRVDSHVHLHNIDAMAKFRRGMHGFGIDVAVSLGFQRSRELVGEMAEVDRRFKGRILFAPGIGFRLAAGGTKGGLWWSMKDLPRFKAAGCVGTKIYVQYSLGLTKRSIMSKIRRQGELGLPLIGLHICDPPEPGWYHPNFDAAIDEAERLIAGCPGTTFIMAHGFWLMNTDRHLDVLDRFFRKYPNLNVDLSAVYQWWDAPEPNQAKLRDFIIRHKARLLYATDGNERYSKKRHYQNSFRMLETREKNCHGFFPPRYEPTYITGFGLPKEVLNYIYWWNAARLIPRVRESLRGLGYDV